MVFLNQKDADKIIAEDRDMYLLETKPNFNTAYLTVEIRGQCALTAEQLVGIEKLYKHWFGHSFRVWLIKRLIKKL